MTASPTRNSRCGCRSCSRRRVDAFPSCTSALAAPTTMAPESPRAEFLRKILTLLSSAYSSRSIPVSGTIASQPLPCRLDHCDALAVSPLRMSANSPDGFRWAGCTCPLPGWASAPAFREAAHPRRFPASLWFNSTSFSTARLIASWGALDAGGDVNAGDSRREADVPAGLRSLRTRCREPLCRVALDPSWMVPVSGFYGCDGRANYRARGSSPVRYRQSVGPRRSPPSDACSEPEPTPTGAARQWPGATLQLPYSGSFVPRCGKLSGGKFGAGCPSPLPAARPMSKGNAAVHTDPGGPNPRRRATSTHLYTAV